MRSFKNPGIVKFLDLGWQTKKVLPEVKRVWRNQLTNSSFILSPAVSEFERAFSEFSKVAYCSGVANGTDALEIGLRSLGVGHGDEVIVPANSFVASAIAVTRAGATPVFVDCEPGTWLIDVSGIESAISPRTKAVMPVHLYGQMASMGVLRTLAEKHGLFIVEDVAQAQGASQDGKTAGSIGDVAGTSFYPGKNLGAMGDGGAVLTMSRDIAERANALRNYGSAVKYQHPIFGFNSRLDSLQAAVLQAKLRHLADWNAMRRSQAEFYVDALRGEERIILPVVGEGNTHVWHLFVVHVENRDEVMQKMEELGVQTGIHYPTPIHLLGMYEHLGHSAGAFPIAEQSAKTAISLPIYPGLTQGSQFRVVRALRKSLGLGH